MLKELLSVLTGSTITASYTNPASNGISGVPGKATFGNFFNTLTSSLSNYAPGPGGGLQGSPQGFPGTQNQAIAAYKNAQNQFAQGFPGQYAPDIDVSRKVKTKALSPGAVVMESLQGQFPQQGNRDFFSPIPALSGGGLLAGGGSPIQGFAGQNGAFGPGQGSFNNAFPQAGFPQVQGNGLGGKLQLLIMPLIGLFPFVKSIFGLRGVVSSMRPVQVDKQDLALFNYQDAYNEMQKQEGSFDEFSIEDFEDENFEVGRLQEF